MAGSGEHNSNLFLRQLISTFPKTLLSVKITNATDDNAGRENEQWRYTVHPADRELTFSKSYRAINFSGG